MRKPSGDIAADSYHQLLFSAGKVPIMPGQDFLAVSNG